MQATGQGWLPLDRLSTIVFVAECAAVHARLFYGLASRQVIRSGDETLQPIRAQKVANVAVYEAVNAAIRRPILRWIRDAECRCK